MRPRLPRPAHALIALALAQPLHALAQQDAAPGHPREQAPPITAGETVETLDTTIFVVFQAQDNTRWFGSDGQGVYRDDGSSIVRFTTQHGLRGNRIRSIQQHRAGTILVGSDGGVSEFDGRTFRPLEVANTDPAAGEWKLNPDDLWFAGGQDEGIVYRYDGASLHKLAFPKTKPGEDHIAKFPRAQFPNMVFNPYDVYIIFKDAEGRLWFGTHVLGACRFDGTTFAWAPKPLLGFNEDDSFGVRSIAQDKHGKFWFSNTIKRIDVEPPAAPAPAAYATEGLRFRSEPGLTGANDPAAFFMSSVKDKNGDLWLATLRAGVWRYDGTTMTHYPVKDGESNVSLFSIYRDRGDTLWLGTHDHGAYRFNGTTFERYKR